MIAPSACCLAHQALHTPKQQLSTDTAPKNQPQLNETQGICGLHTVLSWAGHSLPTPCSLPHQTLSISLTTLSHGKSDTSNSGNWNTFHTQCHTLGEHIIKIIEISSTFTGPCFCHSQMKSQLYSDQASALCQGLCCCAPSS